jgi:hypothetical protein
MTCQETTEARLECKEPTSEYMEFEAEHLEAPKKHAAVETGRAPNKRHRDRHLAEKRRQEPKERTRGNCVFRKKLVAKGTQKGRTEEKRRWKDPECKMGIKDPGTRRQLRLKIERTSDGFQRKAFGVAFVKRATGMSSGLRRVRNWTFWRGRPPLEREIRNWTLWRGRLRPKRK